MPPLTSLIEDREGVPLSYRLQARTLALLEPELYPERFRHHQNVRKENHTVEVESLQWLKACLRRQRRVVAEVEEGSGPGSQRAIFRQIAARLAHEPERRRVPHLTPKGGEKRLGMCVHDHESAFIPGFGRLSTLN